MGPQGMSTPMVTDEQIKLALAGERVVDVTTTGRKSGKSRRIEIWFHNLEGHLYLTGLPGRRSWYANLRAHPQFVFHLKESVRVDLPARAMPVLDRVRRQEIFSVILRKLGKLRVLDEWVERSPLVEVTLEAPSERPGQ